MSGTYAIKGETLTGIADAVREMRLSKDDFRPTDMPEEIRQIHTGVKIDTDIQIGSSWEPWTRPEGYPDLDSIVIPDDFDGEYLTYDLSKTQGYGWIGIYVQTTISAAPNNVYTVERGHLENGTFVSEYSVTQNRATYFREALDEANGMVQLWRVTSPGHISRIAFVSNSATATQSCYQYIQPMVERRAVLPWVTDLSSGFSANATTTSMGTAWMERDNMIPGANSVVTSLSGTYNNCYRLRKVNLNWDTSKWRVTTCNTFLAHCYVLDDDQFDFSSWDTSNWAVTNLDSIFLQCTRLKRIDLRPFKTENWRVTAMGNMFSQCWELQEVLWDGWNTSNWAVTSMASMFNECRNLISIDFSAWDTSNWAVTTIASMFSYCMRLKALDLSVWDVSNWRVTTLASTWAYCYSLLKINFDGWDTSNWAVTTLYYCFIQNYSMKELDLSVWDTSNWPMDRSDSCFNNCIALQKLIVPWDTSKWFNGTANATISSMFGDCRSLKTLDLSTWDTSSWTLKNMGSFFTNCFSLEEVIGLDRWNTENWILTSFTLAFNGCNSLKRLDLSNWKTSNWALTSFANVFAMNFCLEELKGIEDWDTSNWALTSIAYAFQNCVSLRRLDLSKWTWNKWPVTTFYLMLSNCFSMEEVRLPEGRTGESVTNGSYVASGIPQVRERDYWAVNINTNISGDYCVSRASLLDQLNRLPVVTATRTLTMGQSNRVKLTTEELAIATQKGWTIA